MMKCTRASLGRFGFTCRAQIDSCGCVQDDLQDLRMRWRIDVAPARARQAKNSFPEANRWTVVT